MSKLPDAIPVPDAPPFYYKGGSLCVASPLDFAEACFSVPAIRALKSLRPMGKLVVLCPESMLPLWKTVTEIDGVITYPDDASSRVITREIAEWDSEFDTAIIWEASPAGKALARKKIEQRLGYPIKGVLKLLTDPIQSVLSPGPIEHRVRYYLMLVRELGGDPFNRKHFQTPPRTDLPTKWQIGIVRESEYGEAYQWPKERWDSFKNQWEEKYPDVQWVEINKRRSSVKSGKSSQGDTDLEDEILPEVIKNCSALVACDGEIAHWAAHLGVPVVTLFGPGEPAWKRPLGKQNRVVRRHVACSPCFQPQCPMDLRCQNQITEEVVLKELEAMMDDK